MSYNKPFKTSEEQLAILESRGLVVADRAKDGRTSPDVRLDQDTIWLDTHQMAQLFGRDRTVIVRHIRNIYNAKELNRKAIRAKNAQVAAGAAIKKGPSS